MRHLDRLGLGWAYRRTLAFDEFRPNLAPIVRAHMPYANLPVCRSLKPLCPDWLHVLESAQALVQVFGRNPCYRRELPALFWGEFCFHVASV